MQTFLTILIGIIGGIASGLFGIGGGMIFVPLLILTRHVDPHFAIGTSLAVVVPTALMGAIIHGRSGMIDWKTAGIIAACAMIGSVIGSQTSMRLDANVLRKLFSVLMVLLAVKMFFTK